MPGESSRLAGQCGPRSWVRRGGPAGVVEVLGQGRAPRQRERSRWLAEAGGAPLSARPKTLLTSANMCSMTSSGSPYARFQRALATSNLALVDTAARELPTLSLD